MKKLFKTMASYLENRYGVTRVELNRSFGAVVAGVAYTAFVIIICHIFY